MQGVFEDSCMDAHIKVWGQPKAVEGNPMEMPAKIVCAEPKSEKTKAAYCKCNNEPALDLDTFISLAVEKGRGRY